MENFARKPRRRLPGVISHPIVPLFDTADADIESATYEHRCAEFLCTTDLVGVFFNNPNDVRLPSDFSAGRAPCEPLHTFSSDENLLRAGAEVARVAIAGIA